MGSSTTVTQTPGPPSPEETAYINQQLALGQQQLQILQDQQAAQADYMTAIKPILDATAQLTQAQLAAANDPTQQAIVAQTAKLQLSQLEQAGELLPLQKQLLEAQIQQIEQGYAATPEQIKLIDETIAANLASGKSDILDFSQQAIQQLRDELAPSLGLRPTDTPIIDRGQRIAEQAVRQYGQLEKGLQAAGAEAKLNYPLAVAGVSNQASQFQQNLILASQQLAGDLTQQAAANRLALTGAAGQAVQGAYSSGLGLASASAPNALSFPRGATQTTKSSPGFIDILGGIGGLGQGLGAVGLNLSDERLKTDIRTLKFDEAGRRWVTFRYLGEPTKIVRMGVIAQEVFMTDPDAVVVDEDGFLNVDYSKLEGMG